MIEVQLLKKEKEKPEKSTGLESQYSMVSLTLLNAFWKPSVEYYVSKTC